MFGMEGIVVASCRFDLQGGKYSIFCVRETELTFVLKVNSSLR